MRRETGQGKREGYAIKIPGRGDAVWNLQALQHRSHAVNRAKCCEKRCTNLCPQFGQELLRNRASLRFVVLQHRGHASSKKQIEGLIEAKIDAVPSQGLGKATATQHLAIDQYSVAVENDEIGPGHRMFPR